MNFLIFLFLGILIIMLSGCRGYGYDHQPGIEDRPTLEKAGLEQGIILDADEIIMFTPD